MYNNFNNNKVENKDKVDNEEYFSEKAIEKNFMTEINNDLANNIFNKQFTTNEKTKEILNAKMSKLNLNSINNNVKAENIKNIESNKDIYNNKHFNSIKYKKVKSDESKEIKIKNKHKRTNTCNLACVNTKNNKCLIF